MSNQDQDARLPGVEEAVFEDDAPQPMTDEDANAVSGGKTLVITAAVGDKCNINGGLYQTSYAEKYSGNINGQYIIQKYISGRAAPYLLRQNVGWVKVTAVMENWQEDPVSST